MELKEYAKILKENKEIFWLVVAIIVLGSLGFLFLRGNSYSSSLTLDITRQGSQNTADYKFDDFYRLQADEKFSETVVQWLQSPRIVSEVYSRSGVDVSGMTLRQLERTLKPEKLSSQIVSVSFSSKNPESAQKIADSIFEVVSENTQNLNKEQNESAWFKIIAQDPVVIKDSFNLLIVLLAALFIGMFVSFWVVLFFHYIK
jgi:capsular polysaccharide biosynthesis protein